MLGNNNTDNEQNTDDTTVEQQEKPQEKMETEDKEPSENKLEADRKNDDAAALSDAEVVEDDDDDEKKTGKLDADKEELKDKMMDFVHGSAPIKGRLEDMFDSVGSGKTTTEEVIDAICDSFKSVVNDVLSSIVDVEKDAVGLADLATMITEAFSSNTPSGSISEHTDRLAQIVNSAAGDDVAKQKQLSSTPLDIIKDPQIFLFSI